MGASRHHTQRREIVMLKSNAINSAIVAAGLCFAAAPSYAANDVWQFTVTSDQNGPSGVCNALASIPCLITAHASPYILMKITVSGPLAGYATNQTIPIGVSFDNQQLVSVESSTALGLMDLDYPPVVPNESLLINISLNEVSGTLSGMIYLDLDSHGPATIVMTGTKNLWTGYWHNRTDGKVHQIWARSDKM